MARGTYERPPVAERFWSKVDLLGTCWLWLAGADKDGYGKFWADGREWRAHRWSYEWLVGPIPEGLVPDHLCQTSGCVRPEHMELVTPEENSRRAQARKTHCPAGHPYDYFWKGQRGCTICRRASAARHHAKELENA